MRKLLLAVLTLTLCGSAMAGKIPGSADFGLSGKAETSPIFGTPLTHAASLPKDMIGAWCHVKDSKDEYERRECRGENDHENDAMTISKHSVVYFEDGCDFTKVQQMDRNIYYVHGDCGGEEMKWNDSMIFQLVTHDRIRVLVINHSTEKSTEGER